MQPPLTNCVFGRADLEFVLLWFGLSAMHSGHSDAMQDHAWHRFGQAARAYLDLIYPQREAAKWQQQQIYF